MSLVLLRAVRVVELLHESRNVDSPRLLQTLDVLLPEFGEARQLEASQDARVATRVREVPCRQVVLPGHLREDVGQVREQRGLRLGAAHHRQSLAEVPQDEDVDLRRADPLHELVDLPVRGAGGDRVLQGFYFSGKKKEEEEGAWAEGEPEIEKGKGREEEEAKERKQKRPENTHQIRHKVLGLGFEQRRARGVDVGAGGLARVEGADVDSADLRGAEHWSFLFFEFLGVFFPSIFF